MSKFVLKAKSVPCKSDHLRKAIYHSHQALFHLCEDLKPTALQSAETETC